MPQRRPRLEILASQPCSQSWEAMQGTLGQRHCAMCDKQVHNFAAMTSDAIEKLVREKEGHLCARIVYRADSSLVCLDGQSHPSMAAGMVLAASLALGASATAQSVSEAPRAGKAELTGTVLVADGSVPAADASVSLISGQTTVAQAKSDAQGHFRITAEPGRYDISIRQNPLFGAVIAGANLHEGPQSLQPIRTHFSMQGQDGNGSAFMGVMVSTYRYPISFLFKHPLRYLKHMPHNF